MAEAKATARYMRIAPRKARLVADLIRGSNIEEARDTLAYLPKRASDIIHKLLDSAVANAEQAALEKNQRVDTDQFVVRRIEVGEGPTLRRYHSAARGRAVRIRKRTSHITLEISD